MKKIIVIGGGPAALMFGSQIDTKKYHVVLHEKKKVAGRKFLVAGSGGLNLTYHSPLDEFTAQYHPQELIEPVIRRFTNKDLIQWINERGVPTFIGSSNRVFPELDLKPIEVLDKIIKHISSKGVKFKYESEWTGWEDKGTLCFNNLDTIEADFVVFAMGGGSWRVTGSDGMWRKSFIERGIKVQPFRAANCAFGVDWQKNFIRSHEGKPLKNISLNFKNQVSKGELVITSFGLEGNAIYALSQKIQDCLLKEKSTTIYMDLKPMLTVDQLLTKLKSSHRSSVTNILKMDINMDRTSIGVLKQFSDKETFMDLNLLTKAIKSLPVKIHSADKLDNAISTLGGIDLDEIDENFQINKIPNSFAIGEMLDWYAPTGGYLLQACFSMGYMLAQYLNGLDKSSKNDDN